MRVPSSARVRAESTKDGHATEGPKKVSRAARAQMSPEKNDGARDTESSVVLSSRASKLVRQDEQLSRQQAERVAEVKALMDAGRYEIDFDTLSERLAIEEKGTFGL